MYTNESKEKDGVMTRKSTINRTIKFMLILFGIWPNISYVRFCRVFWGITTVILLYWHYRYILVHYRTNDMFDLMDCFSSSLGYVKLFTRFIIFWWNQRIFSEILTMMADDWGNCANSDVEMREATNKAKISARISNAIITFHTMAVLSYGTGIILANADVTDRTIEAPHIFKIEIPFHINTQRTYKIVLITELTYLIITAWGLGMLNAVLLTLTLHVGGQINILRNWLTELVPDTSGSKRESLVVMMNKIIQKHQKIIYFSENIENLYSFIALQQFASNTVMICLLGFLIVTALDNPDTTGKIARALSYYCVTNIEAFVFCYAGEYLMNKSKAIGFAAYNTPWYDLEPKHSRILLFIILRSQKQLTLTVGKMMDLSLRCFASIMNSAGSYLSVLLAMQ